MNSKTSPTSNPSQEIGSPESWGAARRIAALIGEVPNSFSTSVRFLRTDFEQNSGNLSRGTKFYLSRLLKSPSVSAPLYFAAMTFRADEFNNLGGNADAILSVFKPDELAAILSLVYLYRTIKKGTDAEEWKFIEETIHPQVDISGILGDIIPAIGFSNAITASALRPLAHALMLGANKAEYVKYRRALKKDHFLYDTPTELTTWGCTYGQVASILCQPIGLGRIVSEQLNIGYSDEAVSNEPKQATGIRVSTQWLSSVIKTGKEPQIAHKVEFFPHAKDIERFLKLANEIRQSGSRFKWLSQGKESLTPETAPTMFQNRGPQTQSPEVESPIEAEIPAVTEEDLQKIEE